MPLTAQFTFQDLLEELEIGSDAVPLERTLLPHDKQNVVREPVEGTGSPPLNLAAGNGSVDCVRLLLCCGADVGELDDWKLGAIERSLLGQHDEVTSLLLKWDSPFPSDADLRQRLDGLIKEEDEEIRELFERRERLHALVREGDFEEVEEMLKEVPGSGVKRWVNLEGKSALYTASVSEQPQPQLWALLQHLQFVYANQGEIAQTRDIVDDDQFRRAAAEYFVPLKGCHVQKMVAKSMVNPRKGEDASVYGEEIECWYKEMDKADIASDILQCLQCDPYLEVVFDFCSDDVQAMHPINGGGHVYGLMNPRMKRIYAAAGKTQKFNYSDVVSNVTHEMTHRVMGLVFENDGLPYKADDDEAKKEYEAVVEKVVRYPYANAYQNLIDRAIKSDDVNFEMIVKVPEIIVKHGTESGEWDNVEKKIFDSDELMDLYKFYDDHVKPEIRDFIEWNTTANMVRKSEFKGNDVLATSFHNEEVQVKGSDGLPISFPKHKKLEVCAVSNLKLGVSQLRNSGRGYVFVDWSKYQDKDTMRFLIDRLNKNEIDRLAIVWDDVRHPPNFCQGRKICPGTCIAKSLENISDKAVLVTPMHSKLEKCEFLKNASYTYVWSDLCHKTKEWILDKKVNFVGTWTPVRDVLKAIGGQSAEMGELFDAAEISLLIDQADVRLGKALASALEDNEDAFMHCPDQCYIDHKLKVKRIEYKCAKARKDDLVFVRHVEGPFEGMGLFRGRLQGEGRRKARCFSAGDYDMEAQCQRILDQSPGKRDFHFAHLFSCRRDESTGMKRYDHNYSIHSSQVGREDGELKPWEVEGDRILEVTDFERNEAVILADCSGSGKTVFMRRIGARANKGGSGENRWVALVDLPSHEKRIKSWETADLEDPGSCLDLVYAIVKAGNTPMEKRLFRMFFEREGRAVLLLDAFDELSEVAQKKVKALIKTLRKGTEAKVVVSTRAHEAHGLENCMGTVAFDLVATTRKERCGLLNNYWRARMESSLREDYEDKLEEFLSGLSKNKCTEEDVERLRDLRDKVKAPRGKKELKNLDLVDYASELMDTVLFKDKSYSEFSANPLHSFMLAYVVYEEPDRVFVFQRRYKFYDRFTYLKFRIFHRDKKMAREGGSAEAEEAVTNKERSRNLKKLSSTVFLNEEVSYRTPELEYEMEELELKLVMRHGLVVKTDDTPLFVHRTFGEYYFSYWLSENGRNTSVTRLLLEKVFLEYMYKDIRVFLDGMYQNRKRRPTVQAVQASSNP